MSTDGKHGPRAERGLNQQWFNVLSPMGISINLLETLTSVSSRLIANYGRASARNV